MIPAADSKSTSDRFRPDNRLKRGVGGDFSRDRLEFHRDRNTKRPRTEPSESLEEHATPADGRVISGGIADVASGDTPT